MQSHCLTSRSGGRHDCDVNSGNSGHNIPAQFSMRKNPTQRRVQVIFQLNINFSDCAALEGDHLFDVHAHITTENRGERSPNHGSSYHRMSGLTFLLDNLMLSSIYWDRFYFDFDNWSFASG